MIPLGVHQPLAGHDEYRYILRPLKPGSLIPTGLIVEIKRGKRAVVQHAVVRFLGQDKLTLDLHPDRPIYPFGKVIEEVQSVLPEGATIWPVSESEVQTERAYEHHEVASDGKVTRRNHGRYGAVPPLSSTIRGATWAIEYAEYEGECNIQVVYLWPQLAEDGEKRGELMAELKKMTTS
jgi:hypothetical protein